MNTRADAAVAMFDLKAFIGPSQRMVMGKGCYGEERQFFYDKMVEMAEIIKNMPIVYGNEGVDDPIVHLHYFTGGCDWYITEKDTEPEQNQAYGLANIGYGGEMGYISIMELVENNVELDLHFKPRKLSEIKNG